MTLKDNHADNRSVPLHEFLLLSLDQEILLQYSIEI